MRLKEKPLGILVNLLLGISWALVFIGSISSFITFYHNSVFFAILSALIGALPGLAGILFLEHIITNRQKHDELKKQTKLLQKIIEKQ